MTTSSLAAVIQWVVLGIALVGSLWTGWLMRGPRNFRKIASSAVLALAWGFSFTYFAVYGNELCRSSFHLCPDHGDGNMTYWFLPLFATPIYLLFMLAFGSRDDPLVIEPSPYDEAADTAVAQLQNYTKIRQRCPGCHSLIFIEYLEAEATATTQRVYLRCACSKCDRLFDLLIHRPSESP